MSTISLLFLAASFLSMVTGANHTSQKATLKSISHQGAVEIHKYWAGDALTWSIHTPPAWRNEVDQTSIFGLPFYAFDYPAAGTVEIRQYWAGDANTWSFHMPPAWPNEKDVTGLFAGPFYAFDHQAPATTEIRQYWADDAHTWSFHVPPAWPNEKDVTGLFGPLFYAYPKMFCGWPSPSTVGRWMPIGSSNYPTDIKYTEGTRTSEQIQQTNEWSYQVSVSIQESLIFESESISESLGMKVSQMFSSTLEKYKEESYTTHFPAGFYWQFVIDVDDACGGATARGHFVRSTPFANVAPCCLPGYFTSPTSNTCLDASAARPGCSTILV